MTLPVDGTTHASPRSPAANAVSVAMTGERAGDRIGPYVLMERLGAGGFGVVWRAERRESYVQQVAIKLLRPGMDSEAVLARFDQERQALAMMDHPNIAKVIDGGITESGRNYFVMELVKGEPITTFCDRHQLSIEKRLQLIAQACDAIQHAHMKGVIHRDLKPANILASMSDTGSGDAFNARVTVIDFGVAKATTPGLTARQIFTETGQMIGTPEYMSPEQADGGLDLDTRTDIYSLGVVLYELLVGAPPFDPATLRSAGLAAIHRIIRESDPMRPSDRLGSGSRAASAATKAETVAAIARERGVKSDTLIKLLRRELEWLPMKAMRKDRSERYRSAAEFGDDVRNYLSGRALIAGPETASYRVRKFVRRHRAGVLSAAVIAACLLAATAVSTWFGISEARARAVAEQRERDVRQISEFQQDMLESIDPNEMGRTMKDLLTDSLRAGISGLAPADRASVERFFPIGLGGIDLTDVSRRLLMRSVLRSADAVLATFRDRPDVESDLRHVLAITLYRLGQYDEAAQLEDAVLKARTGQDPGSLRTLVSKHWSAKIGSATDDPQRRDAALEQVRVACEGLDTLHGEEAELEAQFALETRGELLRERGSGNEEALRIFQEVERRARRTLATSGNLTSGSRRALLDRAILSKSSRLLCLHELKRADDAAKLAAELETDLGRDAEIRPEAERTVLESIALVHKSDALRFKGDVEGRRRAVESASKALQASRKVHGSSHPYAIGACINLAALQKDLGDPAAGARMLEPNLTEWRRSLSPQNAVLRNAMNTLGWLYIDLGRVKDGEKLVLEATEGATYEGDPAMYESRASVLARTGKLEQARTMYQELCARLQRNGADSKVQAQAMTELARAELALHDLDAARTTLEGARKLVDAHADWRLSDTRWDVLNHLKHAYAEQMKGDPDDSLRRAHEALDREIAGLVEPRLAVGKQTQWTFSPIDR